MKKDKILIIVLILVLAISTIVLTGKKEEKIPEKESETALVPDVIPNVNGIHQELIDKTEKEFPLTLINTATGKSYEIKTTSKYTDFFEYISAKEQSPELNLPEDEPLKTNETRLYVNHIIGSETTREDDAIFVFGAVNENKEDTYFQEARTIYISYYGNKDWELCGAKIGMRPEELKDKLGNPAQEYYDKQYGKSYEYHILKDGHTYSLLINFEKYDFVTKIALNIDNHAVY